MITFFLGNKIEMNSKYFVYDFVKFILIPTMLLVSCNDNSSEVAGTGGGLTKGSGTNGSGTISTGWLIPKNQVLDGGPGKDGIPALENPENIGINGIDYLADDDLVIGFQFEGQVRAYPHKILDWHEIINDDLNGRKVAVTYCPLTGTGIAWSRDINGEITSFGVSGLIYNSNLIPYDRLTDSNWSQIKLNCVNGSLSGEKINTYNLIETTWKTWKEMFPNSSVVTLNTGFNRNYSQFPYDEYRTNNAMFLFPLSSKDDRLPAKDRVLGLIHNNIAKIYQFKLFENGTRIIEDKIVGKNVIVIGNKDKNFIVAFENKLNGATRTFTVIDEGENIMQDDKGNKYNLFGVVTNGVDEGDQLKSTTSFMGYWFSFGTFFTNAEIYEGN